MPDDENFNLDIPILSIDHSIADSFQKAVTLVMLEKDLKADYFFSKCEILINRKNRFKTTISDYLYLLCIHWFRNTRLNEEYTQKLAQLQYDAVISILCQYENKTVFAIFKKLISHRIYTEPDVKHVNFTRVSSDKYLYEATADHCLEMAKYCILYADYENSVHFCNCGKKLYDVALALIPRMLSRKKKKWKELEKIPDFRIKTEFSDEYDEYIKEKEILKGSILSCKTECDLLADVANSMQRKIQQKIAADRILNYFAEVVNPPGKIHSGLSLLDEIIWTMIVWILLPQSGKSAPDILRQYLG